ncbi:MAG: permease-like cell division protein FtsX [Abyssibacter sp.]|uniref:permease-like cell division protein FtsX n=1 Tax=Abyssibacter sp. TaxID=2320200 RepID=UPI002EB83BC9|nr:permease-like cell division protein FtsX [Pseudomonadota bacterium]
MIAEYFKRHAQTLVFTLGRLYQRPVATGLTVLVIGITLALPAGLHLVIQNINAVGYSWEGTLNASLFLADDTDESRARQIASEIRAQTSVRGTTYISRQQALEEFQALSGFGEALELLDENPLPAVIVVQFKTTQSPEVIDAVMRELAELPDVVQAKLDHQWLDRLFAILATVQRAAVLIAALLGVAVVLTVGNTIRLDIENRRDEIVIMKLVGASDAFVRRPFLYTGFWYGLFGGLTALILLGIGVGLMAGPAGQLAALYQSSFVIEGLGFGRSLLLLLLGIALGWFGAAWTVARHLGAIVPR